MTSVIRELSEWATGLQYWEQAALDKVVAGARLGDRDYEELLRYLLEDAGLAGPTEPRPELLFPKRADDSVEPATPVRLVQITNLQNINALAPDQTLTFNPAMTAIYGGNGSGKSGYARVLGCAGFTRGDQEVLPDVTLPADDSRALSAEIAIWDGAAERVIDYRVGRPCPDLGSCYVFDSTSVRVHLTGSNELSFSPAGLSYLPELAQVTDQVRSRLKDRIAECSAPHCFDDLFPGDSPVAEMIADLGPETDLDALRRMADVSEEEYERIGELDLAIARLKAQDIPTQMAALEQQMIDLNDLASHLRLTSEVLGDALVAALRADLEVYHRQQRAAERASVDRFRSPSLTQIGSRAWHQFVEAARALAETEGTSEVPYPQADSHCLLCQQRLSPEARDLLLRLWEFLEGEAQEKLEAASRVLQRRRRELTELDLGFFDARSVPYRYLEEHDPALLAKVAAFLQACGTRRRNLEEGIASHNLDTDLAPLPADGIAEIEGIAASLKARQLELGQRNPAGEVAILEQQMLTLKHRATLREHLLEIEEYIRRRRWARQASAIGGSTRYITAKHNELFARLVTNRYIELFEQTLQDFGRTLRIGISTKGRKGATYKQIVVQADPSVPAALAAPDKVLSEGEKRAVALADFLTEVALDTSSSAVILDDPVTSLDLEWRGLIASILAVEAQRRQVIVFTHDLPFLYLLKSQCERGSVEISTHWIKRGEIDDKPGYVFLNNSPALEREYRKPTRARDIYVKAKDAPAAEQEALLRDGFGALRTTYEAFIIFNLLNEVVLRFDERISFGRLAGIAWDEAIVEEVIEACGRLSRHIEGHLHSDAFGAERPTPRMLLDEIESFEALARRLKQLKQR